MPTLTEEIRTRFERNYTNLVLGAELSLEGQTQVVSDVGHLLKAFDKATAQIARKDEALKRYEQASDDLYSFATRLKRRASSAMEDR